MFHQGTYVAFDREKDYEYYLRLKQWEKEDARLHFINDETCGNDSRFKTLFTTSDYLREKIFSANNMLVLISPNTRQDDSLLNKELYLGLWLTDTPIIFAYTDKDYYFSFFTKGMFKRVPQVVKEVLEFHKKGFAHIPFTQQMIYVATAHYGVNRYYPHRYNEVTDHRIVI